MIAGLIPAAGHSRRMGRPKLALPLGDKLLIEHVVSALRAGGIPRVLVVLGPHVAFMQSHAERAGADVLVLPEATPDMRATVEHGLNWLEQHLGMTDADDWLLVPADHPTLEPSIVRELLAVRAKEPGYTLYIPTYDGKRGHPALIRWSHVKGIRAFPPDEGLNRYFRQQTAQTLEVPMTSPGVIEDLDTPEDYARVLRRWYDEDVIPRSIGNEGK